MSFYQKLAVNLDPTPEERVVTANFSKKPILEKFEIHLLKKCDFWENRRPSRFSKNKGFWIVPVADLPSLPPKGLMETTAMLKELVNAHRYLAELKGVAKTIPNQVILLSTLFFQEAQSSSAIENSIPKISEL